MSAGYLDRLADRTRSTGTVLCLGLDPDPATLPPGFSSDPAGIEAFCRLVLEAASPWAAAVKPNLAFFEAYGSVGLAILERLRAGIPSGLPVILDGKRGDIGSTAARLAVALFDALGADAVTVSPYLGGSAIEPLLERTDRFAYVLCRTSNDGADEFQDLVVAGDPVSGAPAESLALRVARRVASWGGDERVGLVVGATAPDELRRVRATVSALAFLVPGVGAQGGDIASVLAHGPATGGATGARPGGGLLVNVSRGIAGTARDGGDPGERIATAARDWARRFPVVGLPPLVSPLRATANEGPG
jgi:orotidine-5'-phosphate decarboxylase